ncbi:enoyl-CoA hydratase/isomerase family protein [Corynebacterium striatum]
MVAAVRGVALGGGLELALSCDRIVAHADSQLAFPELNVGLYPGWSGTISALERLRAAGVADYHQKAFDFITSTKPFPNAFVAKEQGFLAADDVVLMSPDHVLARAITEAESLIEGYAPPADVAIELYSGPALDREWPLENATENDHVIAAKLAQMYTGEGSLSFNEFADREVEFDVPLVLLPANVDRAKHMAATRKPLRN